MIWNKIKYYVWYPFKVSIWQFLFGLVLICLAIFFFLTSAPTLNIGFKINWDHWLSAYIALATLLFAVFIWYNEKREAWRRALPKKLNIEYLLANGETFCEVRNAPLAGESDIRNWGQSIGQTILNKQTRIQFSGFKISKPIMDYHRLLLVYQLEVYLYEKIDGINKGDSFEFNDDGNLENPPGSRKSR